MKIVFDFDGNLRHVIVIIIVLFQQLFDEIFKIYIASNFESNTTILLIPYKSPSPPTRETELGKCLNTALPTTLQKTCRKQLFNKLFAMSKST